MPEQTELENTSDVSQAFDLLRSVRRRGVLYTVKRNGRTSVTELAQRIADWQSDESEQSADPVAVETSLVHSHLPKLDEADAIEYDREAGAVELADGASSLDPLLERTREREQTLVRVAGSSAPELPLEI